MTKKEQRRLAVENTYLVTAIQTERQRNRELCDANANLRIERDATDVLLGEAMDKLTGRRSS